MYQSLEEVRQKIGKSMSLSTFEETFNGEYVKDFHQNCYYVNTQEGCLEIPIINEEDVFSKYMSYTTKLDIYESLYAADKLSNQLKQLASQLETTYSDDFSSLSLTDITEQYNSKDTLSLEETSWILGIETNLVLPFVKKLGIKVYNEESTSPSVDIKWFKQHHPKWNTFLSYQVEKQNQEAFLSEQQNAMTYRTPKVKKYVLDALYNEIRNTSSPYPEIELFDIIDEINSSQCVLSPRQSEIVNSLLATQSGFSIEEIKNLHDESRVYRSYLAYTKQYIGTTTKTT